MEQFKIINKIGEGAYSTVYTVKRIEDDKIYALKKVKINKLNKKEQINALNEVRILASINSPYVIGYKESFIDESDQTLCIIMEYADDGDLYQKIKLYIQNKTTFMEHDIWRIFIQITKGLNDLHEYNILHRDLKSANVFLFRDGTAKLGDLNVSKITSRGLGCTQTGTPYYASPEVWKDKPYNSKSDIWSLGCVFYELIMLTTPFKAKTMKDLYKKVKRGEYSPIPNNFSPKFQIIIDNILKIKPEERPNAKDILNIPEIVDKIEELKIFDNDKNIAKQNSKECHFETSKNNRINYFNETRLSNIELSKDNDNNNNDNIIIKKLKTRSDNYKKIGRKNRIMNVNKSVELKNNLNYMLNKKYEILNIYKHNLSYFQQKFNQNKKIVLKTIKYPKKLRYLQNKLPGVRYDNNNAQSKNKDESTLNKNSLNIIFPIHKFLPKIKFNKIEIKKKLLNENTKNDNKNENSKKNEIKVTNDKTEYLIMNTLQHQINKENFNNRGKIDIIIKG